MAKTLRQAYLEQFSKNCLDALELTKRKGEGYTAGSDDPFKNFRKSAELASYPGKEPLDVPQSIILRLSDKIERYKSLKTDSNRAHDEPISETLIDLLVYANILFVWEQLGEPPAGFEYLDLDALEIEGQSYTPPIEEPRKPTITDALLKWTKIKG